MKKLTKLESMGLIASILIGGSYFYMKKVYDPEAAALIRTRNSLQKTVSEYNKLSDPPNTRSMTRQVERLEEEVEELTEQVLQAGGRTQAASEITEALAELSLATKRSGMRVVELTLGEERKDDLFTWKTVKISLEGRFADFVSLVGLLKAKDRPVQMRDIIMTKSDRGFGGVRVTAVIWI